MIERDKVRLELALGYEMKETRYDKSCYYTTKTKIFLKSKRDFVWQWAKLIARNELSC